MRTYKSNLKNKLRNGIPLSLIPQIIVVQWLASRPEIIEQYYSTGIYKNISLFFRTLFGWIPFSIGEIIYTLIMVITLRYIFRNWRKIKLHPLSFVRDTLVVLAVFYFTFHLLWGLNYYRQPLYLTLEIEEEASYEEIKDLTNALIAKTNALQIQLTADSTKIVNFPFTRTEVFKKTVANYDQVAKEFPFLKYQRTNLKKSMYSSMSSYIGIGGYLNPFTNEAQVNTKTPLFRFPVVTAHEIGHQVGYSAENETNLIGYIVTQKNEDVYFQYAATAYALAYCLNAIHRTDEATFNRFMKKLNKGVKENYQELQEYHEAYENPLEPIFTSIFNAFLKANNQTDGVKSYSRVVHLLVGYHKKYPL